MRTFNKEVYVGTCQVTGDTIVYNAKTEILTRKNIPANSVDISYLRPGFEYAEEVLISEESLKAGDLKKVLTDFIYFPYSIEEYSSGDYSTGPVFWVAGEGPSTRGNFSILPKNSMVIFMGIAEIEQKFTWEETTKFLLFLCSNKKHFVCVPFGEYQHLFQKNLTDK